jgi:hypothetical protein
LPEQKGKLDMMQDMMMGSGMWGMGLIAALVLLLLVLGVAALVKYVIFK